MTPETARLLAQALKTRWACETTLIGLLDTADAFSATPVPITQSMKIAGETYVHEQRIINRIIEDERDEL